MKKITKIIGIALIFGLIIVGFAGAVSADGENNNSSSNSVDDVSVSVSLPAPETGYAPYSKNTTGSKAITVTENATLTNVTWTPSASVFAYDTAYKATLELTAKTGYTFPSSVQVKVNDTTITATRVSDSKVTVETSEFPKTTQGTISSIEISDITTPVAGGTPDTSAKATMKTSGGVSLTPSTETVTWTPTATTFSAGTKYTMSVTLNPPNGYAFSSNITTSDVKIKTGSSTSGVDAKTVNPKDGGKLEVTYEYPETAKTINSIDITVTGPSTGVTPSTTATVKGNSTLSISSNATVKWHKVTDGTTESTETTSAFEPNTKYKVTVTIPKLTGTYADYTYSSSPTIKINGNAITSDYTISSGVVTASYTFSETGKTKITTVNITNLDSPELGKTPDTSATATGYASGSTSAISLSAPTVEWYLESTKQTSAFEPEKAYTVKIKVTPTTDTEFSTSPTVKIGNITVPVSGITATASSLDISYTYDKTNGTISNVTLTTATPKLGETMSTSVSASSTPTNSINTPTLSWSPSGKIFEGGVEYTSTITITTKNGYTFGSRPTVKLNGSTVSSGDLTVTDTTMTVKHTYDKLATPITSVSISMNEPVVGKEASTKAKVVSIPSSDVDATVSWSPAIPESGLFDEETEYTATITLKNNNSNFTFTSNTTATVTIGKSETVPSKITSTPTATSMTVKCTFEETNKKGLLNLDIGEEEATIPYPKDFFKEIVAFFKAFFDFGSWKIFS